jgi:peptidoglycan hydrolase-like protein with peptidoglycan-binding domain
MSKLLKFNLFLVFALALVFAFTATADAAITKTLRQGMNDAQVMELQEGLNSMGFTVSTSGYGSMGMETSYFGSKTKAAVMAYQTAKGLTVDGIFGPMSLAAWTGTTTGTGTLCPNGYL